MTEKHSYGKSRSGVALTDEVIERMAAKAEAGLDVAKLRHRPGRPRMGSGPAEPLPAPNHDAGRCSPDAGEEPTCPSGQ